MADDWAAAFNKGDAAKVASFYKSDATVFPPGADMIHGRQNIEQFWKKATEGLGDGRFEVTNVEALGSNAAREQGYAWFKTKGDNPQEIHGKYVVVWQKVDGKWEIESDIWNLNK